MQGIGVSLISDKVSAVERGQRFRNCPPQTRGLRFQETAKDGQKPKVSHGSVADKPRKAELRLSVSRV